MYVLCMWKIFFLSFLFFTCMSIWLLHVYGRFFLIIFILYFYVHLITGFSLDVATFLDLVLDLSLAFIFSNYLI